MMGVAFALAEKCNKANTLLTKVWCQPIPVLYTNNRETQTNKQKEKRKMTEKEKETKKWNKTTKPKTKNKFKKSVCTPLRTSKLHYY